MPAHIRFNRELEFEYGVLETVAPSIRRVIARNPSAFTLYGTGTYILGRGEVAVILINHGPGPHVIERGARVAQLVIQRLAPVRFEEVGELSATGRGGGGFGSTGTGRPAA